MGCNARKTNKQTGSDKSLRHCHKKKQTNQLTLLRDLFREPYETQKYAAWQEGTIFNGILVVHEETRGLNRVKPVDGGG
jgi:hypothetical protein